MTLSKDSLKIINPKKGEFNLFNGYNPTPFYLGETDLSSRVNTFHVLDNMFKLLGNEKMINLIRIADNSIKHLFKKEGKFFFRTSKSNIDIGFNDLSSGTKRFIHIINFVLGSVKSEGIFYIDEIELNFHRELTLAIIQAMNLVVKRNKKISFIFTTHNPLIIGDEIKYKQVIEISEDINTGEHISTRLSTLFKSHENVETKYKKGIISKFPSSSFAFDNIYDAIDWVYDEK